ncbi:MAG: ABC transporter permease [Clostridia bacterium]|nr:ABC transporter permease [Clostridia bacterium]
MEYLYLMILTCLLVLAIAYFVNNKRSIKPSLSFAGVNRSQNGSFTLKLSKTSGENGQTETETTAATTETVEQEGGDQTVTDAEKPLDKNVRLLSPTRMVVRRFLRSKLSIVGLVMLISLFVFCWLGPVVYNRWGEIETERGVFPDYTKEIVYDENHEVEYIQLIVKYKEINSLAAPSAEHLLGTDEQGMDVFTRLMYGGRLSLTISFLAVFLISFLGIVLGGLAGYYGGWVDNLIMRICDVLMCLPTLPLMLIIGTVLDSNGVPQDWYIYLLMGILSIFSWPGMARLVRGQILYLREQEYMVAAEAMGYSTGRKIFKHLVPNIMPQIIVSMTLSLGSMILYESTLSYLGLGVRIPYASWGTMVSIISERTDILQNNFNVWGPPGICIIIAVLGFNFIGDGLIDALDPKQRR